MKALGLLVSLCGLVLVGCMPVVDADPSVEGDASQGVAGASAVDGSGDFESLEVPMVDPAPLSVETEAAFRLLITDAPIAAEAVLVEICGVSVLSRDFEDDAGTAEWVRVTDACKSFDLLALRNGITTELGLSALPPGQYGQIRLELKSATIQVDGQQHPLKVPSGVIKIIHAFNVEAGSMATIAVDFDAAKSIHKAHKGYALRPVIKVLAERHERLKELRERARMARNAEAAH